MDILELNKRAPLSRKLTVAEIDDNWQKIEDAINNAPVLVGTVTYADVNAEAGGSTNATVELSGTKPEGYYITEGFLKVVTPFASTTVNVTNMAAQITEVPAFTAGEKMVGPIGAGKQVYAESALTLKFTFDINHAQNFTAGEVNVYVSLRQFPDLT